MTTTAPTTAPATAPAETPPVLSCPLEADINTFIAGRDVNIIAAAEVETFLNTFGDAHNLTAGRAEDRSNVFRLLGISTAQYMRHFKKSADVTAYAKAEQVKIKKLLQQLVAPHFMTNPPIVNKFYEIERMLNLYLNDFAQNPNTIADIAKSLEVKATPTTSPEVDGVSSGVKDRVKRVYEGAKAGAGKASSWLKDRFANKQPIPNLDKDTNQSPPPNAITGVSSQEFTTIMTTTNYGNILDVNVEFIEDTFTVINDNQILTIYPGTKITIPIAKISTLRSNPPKLVKKSDRTEAKLGTDFKIEKLPPALVILTECQLSESYNFPRGLKLQGKISIDTLS